MQSVRAWVLALCSACLVSGLVRILAGGKSRTSVINLVTVLYILLSIVRPALSLTGTVQLSLPKASAASQTVSLTELVRRETEQKIAEEFAQACAERKISARVQVALREESDAFVVGAVTITVQDAAQKETAAQLAEEWFGEDADVLVETGE